jgi:hypothetical protein
VSCKKGYIARGEERDMTGVKGFSKPLESSGHFLSSRLARVKEKMKMSRKQNTTRIGIFISKNTTKRRREFTNKQTNKQKRTGRQQKQT